MAADPAFWLGFAGVAAILVSVLAIVLIALYGYIIQQRAETERDVHRHKEAIGELVYRGMSSPAMAPLFGIPHGLDRGKMAAAADAFIGELARAVHMTATSEQASRSLDQFVASIRSIGENLPTDSLECSYTLATGPREGGPSDDKLDDWLGAVRELASECAWQSEARGQAIEQKAQSYVTLGVPNANLIAVGVSDFFRTMTEVHNKFHLVSRDQRKVKSLTFWNLVPSWPVVLGAIVVAFLLGVYAPLLYALTGGTDQQTAFRAVVDFVALFLFALMAAVLVRKETPAKIRDIMSVATPRRIANSVRSAVLRRMTKKLLPEAPVVVWWICDNRRCRQLVSAMTEMQLKDVGAFRTMDLPVPCPKCNKMGYHDSIDMILAPKGWQPRSIRIPFLERSKNSRSKDADRPKGR